MISVIMPVYNASHYIGEAIESILTQTYKKFEFLILDDGSIDNSLGIINRYAIQDSRIKFWSRSNKGVTKSLNELLNKTKNNLIARMDADDVALPKRFEKQIKYLSDNLNCVAVGCKVLAIDHVGNPLSYWCKQQSHEKIDEILINPLNSGVTVICHPAVMYRRESVFTVGKYREKILASQDLDLFLRLAENGGKLANLSEVLLKYRLHPTSACHAKFNDMWQYGQVAVKEARKRRNLPELPFANPDRSYLIENITSKKKGSVPV